MNPLDSANVATNLKDLVYDSRDHETTIMSARAPVRYPWWVHLMAASIFLANCAKIPRSTHFVQSHLSWLVSDESTITTSDEQAAAAGAVVLCLLSGIVGAVLMYILHSRCSRGRKTGNTGEKDSSRILMWQLIMTMVLVFPDLWFAAVGESPYISWIFLTVFIAAVIAITLRMGRPRNLLATLPVSLFLSFAL